MDPWASTNDLAAARVVVALSEEVDRLGDLIEAEFDNAKRVDVGLRLDVDQLGYLGIHYEVEPRIHSLAPGEEDDLVGRVFEIQLHTKAQNAWASVEHPMLYKPVGRTPSREIQRRVNRAVALVELFDAEIRQACEAMKSEPGYEQTVLLQHLQRVVPDARASEILTQNCRCSCSVP